MVPGQLALRKIAPRLGLGFGLGLGIVLGLGAIFLGGNCPRTVYTASTKIKAFFSNNKLHEFILIYTKH